MNLSERKATTSMIATIHTLKSRVGMDDDVYREFLQRETGKRSAKDISIRDAGRVIEKLKENAGQGGPRGAVAGLDSPIGGKLRALWIAGYDLGVVSDRTDRAMLSFLQRQTGVSHTRFLNDPRAATSAIEALKAWLAREAGVEWPVRSEDVVSSKRAVIEAQWRRLASSGAQPHDLDAFARKVVGVIGWADFEPCHFDAIQNALGRKVRAAPAMPSGDMS